GRFLRVNPALCLLLGYREEELLARDVLGVTHPEDVPGSDLLMEQLAEGRCTHVDVEKRYLRRDGRAVWTQVHGSLGRGASGRPLHFIVQVQDITARRRAQEALECKERELRRLIEELPAPVCIRHGERALYVNPAWARALGYTSPRELVGRS